jgi:hypothetical protein
MNSLREAQLVVLGVPLALQDFEFLHDCASRQSSCSQDSLLNTNQIVTSIRQKLGT